MRLLFTTMVDSILPAGDLEWAETWYSRSRGFDPLRRLRLKIIHTHPLDMANGFAILKLRIPSLKSRQMGPPKSALKADFWLKACFAATIPHPRTCKNLPLRRRRCTGHAFCPASRMFSNGTGRIVLPISRMPGISNRPPPRRIYCKDCLKYFV